MIVSFVLQSVVKPVVAMALYIYAVEGDLPERLGGDPDSMVSQNEQPTEITGH